MKSKINRIILLFSLALSVSIITFFPSCEEDYTGKYKMTDGTPTITFIRPQGTEYAGQLLDGAYMGDAILVIGENLTSVQEIFFNNVKALLNISYITKNTLFVNVPRDLPSVRTDKIYFVTAKKDTVKYDFEVKIPAPTIDRMKCEFLPEGADVVVYGDFFLAADPSRIKVFVGDYEIPTSDIVSYEKVKLVFKAPPMDIKGPIEVKTLYGNSGRTKDIFRDDRGWITGFEDDENGGTGFVAGWGRPKRIEADPEYALMGKYVRFAGNLDPGDNPGWVGGYDDMIINIWSNDNSGISNPMFSSDPATSTLKFEVNVLQAWSAAPMMFYFDHADGYESGWWADGTQPRAFWVPWQFSGPFTTDGWITVAIPLSEFKYNGSGAEVPVSTSFGNLGIGVHNRGMADYGGTACSPVILIDNIRVVP